MEIGTIYDFKNYVTHKDAIVIWDGKLYTSACFKWNKVEREKKFKTKVRAIIYCLKYINSK